MTKAYLLYAHRDVIDVVRVEAENDDEALADFWADPESFETVDRIERSYRSVTDIIEENERDEV